MHLGEADCSPGPLSPARYSQVPSSGAPASGLVGDSSFRCSFSHLAPPPTVCEAVAASQPLPHTLRPVSHLRWTRSDGNTLLELGFGRPAGAGGVEVGPPGRSRLASARKTARRLWCS